MATNLQKFDELVTDLRDDVRGLEKRQTDLTQSNVTLEARHEFLNGEITKLDEQLANSKNTHADYLAGVEKDRIKSEKRLRDAEKAGARISADYFKKNQELTNEKGQLESEQIAITKQIQAGEKEIQEFVIQKEVLEGEISELDEIISRKKEEIAKLSDSVPEQRRIADEAIVEINKEVEQAQKKLPDIHEKIDKATIELDEIEDRVVASEITLDEHEKEYTAFKDYETRANKALQAREEALLKGEDELAVTKRRNSNNRSILHDV